MTKWRYRSLGLLLCVVPITGPVVRQFDAPQCGRCSGHRGITIKTTPGHSVVATQDGVVEFAGSVGGRLYVVQRVSPTVRVTYGWLASLTAIHSGEVLAGEAIGVAADTTYLSVRVGEIHVEPLTALGLGRSRLVPSP